MAAPQTTPCEPWPYECADFPTGAPAAVIDQAVRAATEALWVRTGRRFGLCTLTLRPCREDCLPPGPWIPTTGLSGPTWPQPALIAGQWYNLTCGTCSGGCSCSTISQVTLPYPLAEVVEVKVDGVVLPPSAYRVDDYRFLVRVDDGEWPRCNDLNFDDTHEDTWSVTAKYGETVPETGKLAVGELATEIVRRCTGATCKIPGATVRQVQRQGVTTVFFDGKTAFANGMLGLYYCDMFVSTWGRSGRPLVYDIDAPRARRAGT